MQGGERALLEDQGAGMFGVGEARSDLIEGDPGGPGPDGFRLAKVVVVGDGEESGGIGLALEFMGREGGFLGEFEEQVGDHAGGTGGEIRRGEAFEDATDEVRAVGIGADLGAADAEEGVPVVAQQCGISQGAGHHGWGILFKPRAVTHAGDDECFVVAGGESELEMLRVRGIGVSGEELGDRAVEERDAFCGGFLTAEVPLGFEAIGGMRRRRRDVRFPGDGDLIGAEAGTAGRGLDEDLGFRRHAVFPVRRRLQ